MSTVSVPRQLRSAELRSASFDSDRNTIDVVWTTGATVRRIPWFSEPYDEELLVGDDNVRLDRLNGGAPFLNTHGSWSLDDVLGSVVSGSARIEKGRGLATIQLTRRSDAAGIVQDIRDGVIKNISVGYRYHKIEKIESDDASVPLWRVVDWEPLEISAVPIPADPGSQVRAADRADPFPCSIIVVRNGLDAAAAAAIRMRKRAFSV